MSKGAGGRIFLCHASEDKPSVVKLHAALSRAGLCPWLDVRDIPPASNWDRQILGVLRASPVVIACMSSRMLSKGGYVQHELEMARQLASHPTEGSTRLIIVKLENCVIPAAYRGFMTLDLGGTDSTEAVVNAAKAAQLIYTDPRDGQLYCTVRLAGKTWLAQNLNFDAPESQWYDNQPTRARPFGRLYTVSAARVACPPGWHLPSEAEWDHQAISLGAKWDIGDKRLFGELIEGGRTAFEAVLGGLYDASASFPGFYELHQNGYYWGVGSGERATRLAFSGKMGGRCMQIGGSENDDAISCRCVLDSS